MKLQDVPALSSEDCKPVTAELGDGSPIHLPFHGLEIIICSIFLTPDFTEALSMAPALWILKTCELHRISVATMNAITVDVHSLFDVAMSEVSDRIMKKLQDVPALSSEACEPVTAELGDGSPIPPDFMDLKHIIHSII